MKMKPSATPAQKEDLSSVGAVIRSLVNQAMEDLTVAADLLDHWGLIPESYQYRNFHRVSTLMGQGTSYLLTGSPWPAASRLQSARRSFAKDDLLFKDFLFAKCWEQGKHRQYASILLGDGWPEFQANMRQKSVARKSPS